ncbi:hypothetical protein BAE44_0006474 [Dichanthelium oligosanthes]|uniref:Uncharacterized protein n=1 Tax=Dichanthelium oligosanthes TaxID=888268 RepID=A0A1E5W517_9POAL|nr:hypothetical protein BAE44_0006474 [Dichanthelium oligosanthes]
MFVVGASYVSLIQSTTARCVLPYVSMVCEIAGDGALLCRVEIELPSIGPFCHPRQVFFWASVQSNPSAGCFPGYLLPSVCFSSCLLP